jgi:hypothetical protein
MRHTDEPTCGGGDIQKNEIARETRVGRDRFIPWEQRTAVQRRSDASRRLDGCTADGQEKRAATVERRSPSDRRKTLFVISCKTNGSITRIEDWLDENCKGECWVVLQAVGRDLVRKSLKIMFRLESDRALFHNHYAKGSG